MSARSHVNVIVASSKDVIGLGAGKILNKREVCRLGGILSAEHRRDIEAGYILRRIVIGKEIGKSPSELEFCKDIGGKPYLAEGQLHFNISHSSGRVALVYSDSCVCGIDIEVFRPRFRPVCLLDSSMSQFEQRHIRNSALPFWSALLIWTKKEAYSKMLGVGLSLPFQSICTVCNIYPRFRANGIIPVGRPECINLFPVALSISVNSPAWCAEIGFFKPDDYSFLVTGG